MFSIILAYFSNIYFLQSRLNLFIKNLISCNFKIDCNVAISANRYVYQISTSYQPNFLSIVIQTLLLWNVKLEWKISRRGGLEVKWSLHKKSDFASVDRIPLGTMHVTVGWLKGAFIMPKFVCHYLLDKE